MATMRIVRQWPDGDALSISIKVENSFPDAVREAKRTALDAYAEALGVTVADVAADEAGE